MVAARFGRPGRRELATCRCGWLGTGPDSPADGSPGTPGAMGRWGSSEAGVGFHRLSEMTLEVMLPVVAADVHS